MASSDKSELQVIESNKISNKHNTRSSLSVNPDTYLRITIFV
jgi:hypothetical protein